MVINAQASAAADISRVEGMSRRIDATPRPAGTLSQTGLENEPADGQMVCPSCGELAWPDSRRGRWVGHPNVQAAIAEVPYLCPHGHEFLNYGHAD